MKEREVSVEEEEMTRGKQKINAQRRNVEKNQKQKGSQLEDRAVAHKVTCPICKIFHEYDQEEGQSARRGAIC